MSTLRAWRELRQPSARALLRVLIGPPLLLGLVAAGLLVWQMHQQARSEHQAVLAEAVSSRAAVVSARLEAAAVLSAAWSFADLGWTPAKLQARVAASTAFAEVSVVPVPVSRVSPVQVGRFSFNRAQLASLAAGSSILLRAADERGDSRLHLVRQANHAGTAQLLIFELDRDWLWGEPNTDGLTLSLLDSQGLTLAGNAPGLSLADLSPPLQLSQSHAVALAAEDAAADLHAATIAVVPPVNLRMPLLHIVASSQMLFPWMSAVLVPLFLLLLAVSATLITALLLTRRYRPWFETMADSLRAMAALQWPQMRPLPLLPELLPVNGLLERVLAAQIRQWQGLQLQTQIHEALLAAPELEPVLDAMLPKLRKLLEARALGLVLISADMPQYGRVYVAHEESGEYPVQRVSLDESMMKLLANSAEGLTIMRYEPQRHSFLLPSAANGAQLFWAWPVMEADRLAGILTVGYDESEQLDPQLAQRGTDSARRLGTVISRGSIAERLYRQAHFDALTQLPNRLLFRDRLAQSVAAALSANSAGALLYIDLDHFKKINDAHGHAAGDHLLSIVAQRLRACVKDGDTVARLAGDEFTVILSQVTAPQAAMAVAQRILESLQMPVTMSGAEHQVYASVGVSVFPQDGTGIDELLRNADMAMYRAKDRGRRSVVLFEPQMNDRQLRVQDAQLQSALNQREFALYYQPQFSLADGSLLAVEALLRWHSPRDGLRTPDDFVPAAEESGLIVDIGQWVLEAACSQYALWRLQGLPQPMLSINVSQQQLRANGYASALQRMLEKYAFDPERLEIELPLAVFYDERSLASLQALQRLNVRLALANLTAQEARNLSVRDLPIRTVKLAQQFVADLPQSAEVTRLAGQIITQCHAVSRRVVAEGVETVDQMDLLREHGCDVVQGYYLARPLNVAGITELLSVRRPHTLQRGAATA